MTVDPSWNLLVATITLMCIGVAVAMINRFSIHRSMVVAVARAALQLLLVSSVVVAAIGQVWTSLLFIAVMFTIAVWTTTGRVGTRSTWWWSALSLAAGVLPTLLVVFASRTAPFNGMAMIPIGSIIIGNTMAAHTLAGHRFFPELRFQAGVYEAGLALGMNRVMATRMVLGPIVSEPLVPSLDSTRTVGLVTLPGAYVGVLMGGGTALQAGAAQLLVLVGIVVSQTVTVAVMTRLITSGRLLPDDLITMLHP